MDPVITAPVFHASREVPAEWIADLRAAFPKSTQIPFPWLTWMPGEVYDPVQRWVIYELVPDLDTIAPLWLDDIRGDDPRNRGRWVPEPRVPGGKRWWSDAFVSHQQWELYRETNCYPALYWIIQGRHGGHKWRLTQAEKQLLRYHGAPKADVPLPGDLPYAPFDRRVIDRLRERDKLHAWDRACRGGWQERTKHGLSLARKLVLRERRQVEIEARWQLYRWLREQVSEGVDVALGSGLDVSTLPPGDRRYDAGEEQELAAFIAETPTADPDQE